MPDLERKKRELEVERLSVEIKKFMAESRKLNAEAAKLKREEEWYPFAVGTGLVTAVVATLTLLMKFFA